MRGDLGNESENSKKQEQDPQNIRKYLRHKWPLCLARALVPGCVNYLLLPLNI